MFCSGTPRQGALLKSSVIFVILAAILAHVKCQVADEAGCDDGAVVVNAFEKCPREYLRCDRNVWRRNMCAGGVIQAGTGECAPFNAECPYTDDKLFLSREKRQAVVGGGIDCSQFYLCPPNLNSIFVYPDWSNLSCSTYITCAAGELFISSCKDFGYNYYNPRTLSCEQFASPTNTCVQRQDTDLSPIFQQQK